MKILVTGSEGFIGAHLTRELRNVGHVVIGMDIKNSPRENVAEARNVEELLELHRPTVVVHLASQIGPLNDEIDVMETVRDCVGMTAVVAKAAAKFDARVVYASSDDVYPDVGEKTCFEQVEGRWNPPSTLYGLAKTWGEQVCELYAPKRFVALRFASPFGPGLDPDRAGIIDLLWRAKHGAPMPVFRGEERSWCWIGDSVRAARLAIENGNGPYNVGRSDTAATAEIVAGLACDIAGADHSLIKLLDAPEGYRLVERRSSHRLGGLRWRPEISLFDGMKMTYDEWVDHIDASGTFVEPELVKA